MSEKMDNNLFEEGVSPPIPAEKLKEYEQILLIQKGVGLFEDVEIKKYLEKKLNKMGDDIKNLNALSDAIDCISSFENKPSIAIQIANKLELISHETKSQEAISKSAKTISSYPPESALVVAAQIEMSSSRGDDEEESTEMVLFMAANFDNEEVKKTILNFKDQPNVASKIIQRMGNRRGNIIRDIESHKEILEIATYYRNKEIKKIAKEFNNQPETPVIVDNLGYIYFITKSKEAMLESAKAISLLKKDPKEASKISGQLASTADNEHVEKVILEAKKIQKEIKNL